MSMRVLYRILLWRQKILSQTVLVVFAQYDIFSVSSTYWRFSEITMQTKQIVADVTTFGELDDGALFVFVAELVSQRGTTIFQKFTLFNGFNAVAHEFEGKSCNGGRIHVHDSDEVILLK